jgi:DNA-binding NarL/FixJ family response regulator
VDRKCDIHGSSVQILVADDNLLMRTQPKKLLIACNSDWTIHEADSAAQTLEKTLSLRPDLVVLDLNLPDMSGAQTATKIRQISPSPKIMICSFSDDSYLSALAKGLGVDGYFGKSSSPDELCKTVKDLLAAKN